MIRRRVISYPYFVQTYFRQLAISVYNEIPLNQFHCHKEAVEVFLLSDDGSSMVTPEEKRIRSRHQNRVARELPPCHPSRLLMHII